MGRATLEEVRTAAYAASAYAAYTVYTAANVAYAASAYAANVASNVAIDAAYVYAVYASDGQEQILKQCADTIREHYPVCPL